MQWHSYFLRKVQEADAGAQAADASRMRDVMSRCGALGSERPRATFKVNNLEQDLTRLLKSGNVEQHRDVLERKLASAALAGQAACCQIVCSPGANKRQGHWHSGCPCPPASPLTSEILPSAGVMTFSEVLSDISNHGKYSLSLYDMGRYMRLDAAAQRALNVMKTKFDANDNFSLYGLLSRARTSMGKRLLKASSHILTTKYYT